MIFQKVFTFDEVMKAWMDGMKELIDALLVLIFAWAFGAATKDLMLPDYIANALGDDLDIRVLPLIIFLLGTFISLATGTAWGTMVILFPIAVPLANDLSGGEDYYLVATVASVLSGAVFGDQCTPISDTSILACLSTGCELTRHIKTQAPYAAVVFFLSTVFGNVMTGFKIYPIWVAYFLVIPMMIAFLLLFGKNPDAPAHDSLFWKLWTRCCSKDRQGEGAFLLMGDHAIYEGAPDSDDVVERRSDRTANKTGGPQSVDLHNLADSDRNKS